MRAVKLPLSAEPSGPSPGPDWDTFLTYIAVRYLATGGAQQCVMCSPLSLEWPHEGPAAPSGLVMYLWFVAIGWDTR